MNDFNRLTQGLGNLQQAQDIVGAERQARVSRALERINAILTEEGCQVVTVPSVIVNGMPVAAQIIALDR